MGRYKEIVASFNGNPDEFDPILGPEGDVIASDWAGGFLDAVALRPEVWKVLMEDTDAGMLMLPLILLNGDLEFDDSTDDEDEFLAEAPDMISTCVAGIYAFWERWRRNSTTAADRPRRMLAAVVDSTLKPGVARSMCGGVNFLTSVRFQRSACQN